MLITSSLLAFFFYPFFSTLVESSSQLFCFCYSPPLQAINSHCWHVLLVHVLIPLFAFLHRATLSPHSTSMLLSCSLSLLFLSHPCLPTSPPPLRKADKLVRADTPSRSPSRLSFPPPTSSSVWDPVDPCGIYESLMSLYPSFLIFNPFTRLPSSPGSEITLHASMNFYSLSCSSFTHTPLWLQRKSTQKHRHTHPLRPSSSNHAESCRGCALFVVKQFKNQVLWSISCICVHFLQCPFQKSLHFSFVRLYP